MASGDLLSSPATGGGNTLESDLAYYKSQYEQLEVELQEFQASSKELEAELEKDIEASEKRERQLKEKVESLGYEADEWKTKHKQSKTEANNAQNVLQKEITELRETNRALQLKLRDIEVANDDFERQARNTTSSLEDLESKYNVAIERGVMLEEEIKAGEQERESLRIQTQRLRDELSDLKVESEIVQEKLRNAEATIEQHHEAKAHALTSDTLRPPSPVSETSTSATTLSSPTASTPPPAKSSGSASTTPPSPPLSETSANVKATPKTPMPTRKRSIVMDSSTTPRPAQYRPPRHSRGASIPVSTGGRSTPSISRQPPTSKPAAGPEGGPRAGSLYQIRGLIGKMQRLEERVHSARSRLPAPTHTPPRASPRSGSALDHHIPATVTVRSRSKRTSGSTASSSAFNGDSTTPTANHVSRLSFGGAGAPGSSSRPSSRASVSSHASGIARPSSRSSMSGARTPLGHYDNRRPRSSLAGGVSEVDEGDDASASRRNSYATPAPRRTELDKSVTGIPTPSGLPRRQSGGLGSSTTRRTSAGPTPGDMGPPERRRKLSEVGETF